MSSDRPQLSFQAELESRLRAAVEGVAREQYVECLRQLARASMTKRQVMLARMATNAALTEAVRNRASGEVDEVIGERVALGFESVTDWVLSFQPVVVAALTRRELRGTALNVLAEIDEHAGHARGVEQKNAKLFTSRMRRQLGPPSRRAR